MSQTAGGQRGEWTVLADGKPIVTFTSFLDMDFKGESKVAEQPTENGGFVDYNKVQTPNETYVALAMQGSDTDLGESLDKLDNVQAAASLLEVVTPTRVISNVTLVGFNYRRRREDGLGVLFVELRLKEVRQVQAQYANIPRRQAKNPSDASKVDRGKVQPKSLALQGKEGAQKFFGGGNG